jgi:hypothetical protein
MRKAWQACLVLASVTGGLGGCESSSDEVSTSGQGGSGGATASGGSGTGGGGALDAGVGASGGADAGPQVIDPMALSERLSLGEGSDPDVAVDATGALHVVYARGGSTFYRKVDYPGSIGPELIVGAGADPQVAVDSQNQPHVVMGAVSYARYDGNGFTAPSSLGAAWRKPRLALDASDRVYVTVSRNQAPRVILWVVDSGAVIAGPVAVGEDNNGAVSIDSAGTAQVVWRAYNVNHSTYTIAGGATAGQALHPSSDFSWCAVDLRDDSLHVVNTIREGLGITYRSMLGGVWSDPVDHGVAEVTGVDNPDNVGPTIDVDSDGFKYVAFAGRDRVPYYFVIDPNQQWLGTALLDPEEGSLSGGKFENPNVGSQPDRRGAFVAWGNGQVYLRGIGLPE